MYLEVFSEKKKVKRLLRCRHCVTRGPYYRQVRVHIHNFTKVNLRDFVVGPLVQSSRTPDWEPPLYLIDNFFSF